MAAVSRRKLSHDVLELEMGIVQDQELLASLGVTDQKDYLNELQSRLSPETSMSQTLPVANAPWVSYRTLRILLGLSFVVLLVVTGIVLYLVWTSDGDEAHPSTVWPSASTSIPWDPVYTRNWSWLQNNLLLQKELSMSPIWYDAELNVGFATSSNVGGQQSLYVFHQNGSETFELSGITLSPHVFTGITTESAFWVTPSGTIWWAIAQDNALTVPVYEYVPSTGKIELVATLNTSSVYAQTFNFFRLSNGDVGLYVPLKFSTTEADASAQFAFYQLNFSQRHFTLKYTLQGGDLPSGSQNLNGYTMGGDWFCWAARESPTTSVWTTTGLYMFNLSSWNPPKGGTLFKVPGAPALVPQFGQYLLLWNGYLIASNGLAGTDGTTPPTNTLLFWAKETHDTWTWQPTFLTSFAENLTITDMELSDDGATLAVGTLVSAGSTAPQDSLLYYLLSFDPLNTGIAFTQYQVITLQNVFPSQSQNFSRRSRQVKYYFLNASTLSSSTTNNQIWAKLLR